MKRKITPWPIPIRAAVFVVVFLGAGSAQSVSAATPDEALGTLGRYFDVADSLAFAAYATENACAVNPALGLLLRKYINSYDVAPPEKVSRAVGLIDRLASLKEETSDFYRTLASAVLHKWAANDFTAYRHAVALRRYGARNDASDCRDSLAMAAALFLKLGCDDASAETDYTSGEVFYGAEQYVESIARFTSARDIGEHTGNLDIVCRARLGLSSALGRIPGRFAEAIQESERARELIGTCEFQQYTVNYYTRLGVVYFYLGDYESAAVRFRAADSVARALSNAEERLYPLEHMALSLQLSGRLNAADSVFEKSACLADSLDRPVDVAWMHVYQADVRIGVHDTIGTRTRLVNARELLTSQDDQKGVAVADYQLGRLESDAGHYTAAIESLQRARVLLTDRKDRIYALKELGLAYLGYGAFDSSLYYLGVAASLLDSARAEVPSADLRRNYLRDKEGIVYGLIEAHLHNGDTVAALDVAEAYRAMSFDEAIEERQAQQVSPERYSDDEVRLRDQLSETLRDIRTCSRFEHLPGDVDGYLRSLQDSLSDLLLQASVGSPRPARSDAADHAWLLESSGHGVLSLYYFVLNDHIMVWSCDGQSMTFCTPTDDRPQLRHDIETVLSQLKHPPVTKQDTEQIKEKLQGLADLIPREIRSSLQDFSYLRIYPAGVLSYLPFGTIRIDNRYLGEILPIEYWPSVSMNKHQSMLAHSQDALRSVGVFGGSHFADGGDCKELSGFSASLTGFADLPGVKHEISAIARMFPTGISDFCDSSDQEGLIRRTGGAGMDVLHFATHGIVSDENPQFSCLVLPLSQSSSQDGVLLSDEILSLRLHSRLVVLSACQTGLGPYVNGEGILGLSRAFIIAGARSVVVSLWPLNDAASAMFMESFYSALAKGESTGEALFAARRRMILQTPFTHPYYWAPLIAQGNWK